MYFIEHGEVDVRTLANGDTPLATLGAGSFFGEMALLASDGRTKASVKVSIPCVTMSLTRHSYLSVCQLHPAFKRYVESVARLRLKRMEMDPSRASMAASNMESDDLQTMFAQNAGRMRKKSREPCNAGPRKASVRKMSVMASSGFSGLVKAAPRAVASRLSVAAGCRSTNGRPSTAKEKRWGMDRQTDTVAAEVDAQAGYVSPRKGEDDGVGKSDDDGRRGDSDGDRGGDSNGGENDCATPARSSPMKTAALALASSGMPSAEQLPPKRPSNAYSPSTPAGSGAPSASDAETSGQSSDRAASGRTVYGRGSRDAAALEAACGVRCSTVESRLKAASRAATTGAGIATDMSSVRRTTLEV